MDSIACFRQESGGELAYGQMTNLDTFQTIQNRYRINEPMPVVIGARGRPKRTNSNKTIKVENVSLFWVYIAIFRVKYRIIGRLGFPQLRIVVETANAPASCHNSHGFFSFYKLTSPNRDTLCPTATSFHVSFFHRILNPFAMCRCERFEIIKLT